jgi:hypothetical protein
MTNFLVPTNTATRLKYGSWEIALWLSDFDAILGGRMLNLVYNDSGSAGWVNVATIDGPYTDADWTAIITAAGGMGNYIVSKLPAIKAALKKYFDTTPSLPVITNATPFSQEAFNDMLYEYVKLQDDPGTGHPTVVITGYTPPPP